VTAALLTPADFRLAWGADGLVRLQRDRVVPGMSDDATHFLVGSGLPALTSYFEGDNEQKITFCRLGLGLSPILQERIVGGPLPADWSVYWVIGDEFFCNGSAWWCLHKAGHVVRIDIELTEPIELANSSVADFATALWAAVTWSQVCDRSPALWPSQVDRLRDELISLDAPGMRSEHSFWPRYLAFIRNEPPASSGWTKGSRSDGECAWKAGPW
jgi:hypothetical protein